MSDTVMGGQFTCSLTAVPAFSSMKLLTRRKLIKVSQCVHECLISTLGLILFVEICVTFLGGLRIFRYDNATGVDREVKDVDVEQISLFSPSFFKRKTLK